MDRSFSAFMKLTKPGPSAPCPICNTFALRRYTEPTSPDDEKIICTNSGCPTSPFHRDNPA